MAENVINYKSDMLLSGSSGNDTISNGDWLGIDHSGGSKVTIKGWAGNDRLCNDSNGSLSAVYGGDGADKIFNYATKTIIDGEAGKDYLYNYRNSASLTSIYGGEGEDNISNYGYRCKIDGGDGADTISNQGAEVTIYGGAGYDLIVNYYSYSSLTAIYGGDGADTISNGWASIMTLDGGNGADVIKNGADNVTITGGKGDDKIILYGNGREALLTYKSGDGNDSIEGFNETSTLSISDANFSTTKSGNDIFVNVGNDMILLVGAADLSKVNIVGAEKNSWKISGNTATYGNLITISGVASGATAANFYIKGNTVTIGKTAVQTNGTPVKLLNQNNYSLKLGKGMTESTNVTTAYNAKTMTYTTAGKTEGYSLSSDKKSISYNSATSKEFKFSGVASGATAANFYIKGNTVTIGKAAVQTNGTPVKLLNQSGYTLKLGKGMEAPTNNAAALKNGVYTFGSKSEGYVLDTKNNTIKYSAATSATLELSGVKSAPTVPTDDTLTLKLTNFDKNLAVTSNTGKYKFSIASGTYTGKTFTGSNGNDTISNAGASLIINSGAGNDSIKSTGANSTINAGAGADTIAGSSGADTLLGDAGNDIIWGGKGNDSILGGAGNDSLSGAAGNDSFWGGAGNDTLIGGAGNDIFIYKPGEGTDHITDYASGDMLKILNADGTNGTFSKAAFADNKLTLTVSGGGNIIFDNVSAGDKINFNGTTKTISGNTLK